jgi:hypothetical protein
VCSTVEHHDGSNKWRLDSMTERSRGYFAPVISCIVIGLHELRHLVRHRLWCATGDVKGEQKIEAARLAEEDVDVGIR